MNIRSDKQAFLARLQDVREKLPTSYAILLKQKFPNVKSTKFYSVKRGVSVCWEILSEMEKMVQNQN